MVFRITFQKAENASLLNVLRGQAEFNLCAEFNVFDRSHIEQIGQRAIHCFRGLDTKGFSEFEKNQEALLLKTFIALPKPKSKTPIYTTFLFGRHNSPETAYQVNIGGSAMNEAAQIFKRSITDPLGKDEIPPIDECTKSKGGYKNEFKTLTGHPGIVGLLPGTIKKADGAFSEFKKQSIFRGFRSIECLTAHRFAASPTISWMVLKPSDESLGHFDEGLSYFFKVNYLVTNELFEKIRPQIS